MIMKNVVMVGDGKGGIDGKRGLCAKANMLRPREERE